jgi:hypothetical protein
MKLPTNLHALSTLSIGVAVTPLLHVPSKSAQVINLLYLTLLIVFLFGSSNIIDILVNTFLPEVRYYQIFLQ